LRKFRSPESWVSFRIFFSSYDAETSIISIPLGNRRDIHARPEPPNTAACGRVIALDRPSP
jgi:hypothetical protein